MTNNSRLDEEMSPQKKRAMLAQLLREKAGGNKSYYCLSYEQRAMWFQSQLMPDSSAYNLAEAIKIKGDLDISTMRIALQ